MELEIAVRHLPKATVVAVGGEVDVFTAPQLDSLLAGQIQEGHTTLVLDFTHVEFLDSTGLGVVVKAIKKCQDDSGSISVVVATERIRRIFEITGLDRSIRLAATVAEVVGPPDGDLDPDGSDRVVDG